MSAQISFGVVNFSAALISAIVVGHDVFIVRISDMQIQKSLSFESYVAYGALEFVFLGMFLDMRIQIVNRGETTIFTSRQVTFE